MSMGSYNIATLGGCPLCTDQVVHSYGCLRDIPLYMGETSCYECAILALPMAQTISAVLAVIACVLVKYILPSLGSLHPEWF